jgi:osmotically-inducible protein OsmY
MKQSQTRRLLIQASAVALIAAALGGCAAAIVGGAVVGGMVATDRRTTGAQVDDQNIELRAANNLSATFGDRAHLTVTSYNAQVLLTGEVPTAQDKQLAEQIVSRVPSVRAVVNELAVMPNATIEQRSSDSLITAQIKAAMVDSSDIFANLFKVVTERGTVYLMGRVTRKEADKATETVRGVGGVRRVVRVLEIVSEAELYPAPSPQAPASAPAPKS